MGMSGNDDDYEREETFEDDLYLVCHRCGKELEPGKGDWYQVSIKAVADPDVPGIDTDMSLYDISREIGDIVESVKGATERELLDDVYRNVTLHLCRPCFREWIEDPARR